MAFRPDEAKSYRSDFVAAARIALSRAKVRTESVDVLEPADDDEVDVHARTEDPYAGAGMWG